MAVDQYDFGAGIFIVLLKRYFWYMHVQNGEIKKHIKISVIKQMRNKKMILKICQIFGDGISFQLIVQFSYKKVLFILLFTFVSFSITLSFKQFNF
jgi:hypothetical protein